MLAEAERLVQAHVLREKEDVFFLTFHEFHEAVRTSRVDEQLDRAAGSWFAGASCMKAIRILAALAVALAPAFSCGEIEVATAPEPWAACEQNSDCTIAAASCCGVCGEPSLDDVDAVNKIRSQVENPRK